MNWAALLSVDNLITFIIGVVFSTAQQTKLSTITWACVIVVMIVLLLLPRNAKNYLFDNFMKVKIIFWTPRAKISAFMFRAHVEQRIYLIYSKSMFASFLRVNKPARRPTWRRSIGDFFQHRRACTKLISESHLTRKSQHQMKNSIIIKFNLCVSRKSSIRETKKKNNLGRIGYFASWKIKEIQAYIH